MSLVDHAIEELNRAGLFDADSDYNGMLAKSVVDLMKVFADQGHSGMSAGMTRDLFNRLANYEVLTPITSDPTEWNDVSEMTSKPMWQSRRDSRCFSENGGATWTRLADA